MPKKPLKTYSLEEMKDKHIGKIGTPERNQYEHELRMELAKMPLKTYSLEEMKDEYIVKLECRSATKMKLNCVLKY